MNFLQQILQMLMGGQMPVAGATASQGNSEQGGGGGVQQPTSGGGQQVNPDLQAALTAFAPTRSRIHRKNIGGFAEGAPAPEAFPRLNQMRDEQFQHEKAKRDDVFSREMDNQALSRLIRQRPGAPQAVGQPTAPPSASNFPQIAPQGYDQAPLSEFVPPTQGALDSQQAATNRLNQLGDEQQVGMFPSKQQSAPQFGFSNPLAPQPQQDYTPSFFAPTQSPSDRPFSADIDAAAAFRKEAFNPSAFATPSALDSFDTNAPMAEVDASQTSFATPSSQSFFDTATTPLDKPLTGFQVNPALSKFIAPWRGDAELIAQKKKQGVNPNATPVGNKYPINKGKSPYPVNVGKSPVNPNSRILSNSGF